MVDSSYKRAPTGAQLSLARRHSKPFVIVVVVIPPAIKGAGIAAAGVGAVGKAIHKYYKVKKTRNEAKRAEADAEATRTKAEADVETAAETDVAEAERRRIEAETELCVRRPRRHTGGTRLSGPPHAHSWPIRICGPKSPPSLRGAFRGSGQVRWTAPPSSVQLPGKLRSGTRGQRGSRRRECRGRRARPGRLRDGAS